MNPSPDRLKAEEIFDKINSSYMAFNKGAKHGINHNTELVIKSEIEAALTQARNEAYEEAALETESLLH